jgi:hypothetical protein
MKKSKATAFILISALIALCLVSCAKPEVKDDYTHHCTLYIDCKTILNNMDQLDPEKAELIPEDGIILPQTKVGFEDGDSVYDILLRELLARGIHIESSFAPVYDSAYVEGINNIYEFDCGPQSGWEYRVNGEFPNYGCSSYHPQEGDEICFIYTCELGADIGDIYGD